MIFLDPWSHLQEKLDYIIKVMHVDIRDLAECGAVLYQDLEHIEVMQIFMIIRLKSVLFEILYNRLQKRVAIDYKIGVFV